MSGSKARFTDRGKRHFIDACEAADMHKIASFLHEGMDVNFILESQESHRQSPLHAAAYAGRRVVCEQLLAKGWDTNLLNKVGEAPLACAARGGYLETVDLLLRRGARVGAKDTEGRTALWVAAHVGASEDVCRMLLDAGADCNDSAPEGDYTVLMAAVIGDGGALVDLLVARGADLRAKTKDGESVLALAVEEAVSSGNNAAVLALVAQGAPAGRSDLVARCGDNMELADAIRSLVMRERLSRLLPRPAMWRLGAR